MKNSISNRRGFLKSSLRLASVTTLSNLITSPSAFAEVMINTADTNGNNQEFPQTSVPSQPLISPLLNFTQIKQACEANRSTGVPIHLLAPSGFGNDEQRNLLAIQRLTQAGFYVDNPEIVERKYLRFAGTDNERLDDFKSLLNRPVTELPKILLGVRGGYGAMRLLNGLTHRQWQTLTAKLKQRGTLLIGFSDFTALQLGMLAQGNLPYVAGAMLGSDFGKPQVNEPTIQSFIKLCTQSTLTIEIADPQPYLANFTQPIMGKLWGGNLSVLSALVGTPYMPVIENGILFIEDVGEQPYRIERMLQTLILSGILAKQKAIILGKFNFNGITDAYDGDYTFNTVIQQLQANLKIPIFTEFPFGHVAQRINFPLGVPVLVHQKNTGYQVQFNEFFNLQHEKNVANLDLGKLLL